MPQNDFNVKAALACFLFIGAIACGGTAKKVEVIPRKASTNTNTSSTANGIANPGPAADGSTPGGTTPPGGSSSPTVPNSDTSSPSGSPGSSPSAGDSPSPDGSPSPSSTPSPSGDPSPGSNPSPSSSPSPSGDPSPSSSGGDGGVKIDVNNGGKCLKFNTKTLKCEVQG